MAGIDQITKEILDAAQKKADQLIAEANKKADSVKETARTDAAKASEKAAAKAESEAEGILKRAESQAGLRKRQTLLAARQEIISDVMKAAEEKLKGQADDDYFGMLLTLVGKHAAEGEGTLSLSAADLKRLPAGFAAEAAKLAAAKGGSIRVAEQAADIDDGFILSYGGIEENCTLKALFAEKEDALRDAAHAALWA